MLDAPTSAASAGLWAIIVAAVLLLLGYLIADAFPARRDHDVVVVWGLSFVALAGFAAALMCVHMMTRGWLFSSPATVRVLVVGSLAALTWRKGAARLKRDRPRDALLVAGVLVVAGLLIWGSPVFRMLPLTATADTQLHNGWINQMLDGYTTPGAVITGDVPNYYPWLFHALASVATHLIPGSEPYLSLGVLQLIFLWGQTLALFALGRALWGRVGGGAGVALLGALAGGIGFVALDRADVVMDPRAEGGAAALRYLGDLLFSRSYNVAFHGLAPPFPRDMAFVLVASFLLVLSLALRTPSARAYATAGAALGLVGLTGGESFIVAFFVGVVAVLVVPVPARGKALAALVGAAVAVYALWAIPMAVNYVALGGFVSITHIISVDLPARAILGAWGISALLATIGAVHVARRRAVPNEQSLAIVYLIVSGLVLLGAEQIPKVLGDAFDTLGRPHRYWPLFHLGIAILGGLGFSLLVALRPRALAIGAIALAGAVAVASPLAASLGLPKVIGSAPLLDAALAGDEANVLNVLNEGDRFGCIAAVPQDIAREVFSYTGYPLVLWTGNWFGPNRARIRWADIYERIPGDKERLADNRVLVNGWGPQERIDALVEKYDVDLIVTPDHLVQEVGECGS